jgi:hypothetical protein
MLLQQKGRSENKGIFVGSLTVVAMADICRMGRSLDIDMERTTLYFDTAHLVRKVGTTEK